MSCNDTFDFELDVFESIFLCMFWRKDKFKNAHLKEFWRLLHQVSERKHLVLEGWHIDSIVLAIVDTFKELENSQVKYILWLEIISFLHETRKKIIDVVHSIILGD
jgi:hypothetical protein